jgi:histone H3/H4
MEISQLALKRLFHRAGIKRISNKSYDKLYGMLNLFVSNILDKSVTLSNNRQNNTLNSDDIYKGYYVSNLLTIIENESDINQEGGEYTGYCDSEPSQCGILKGGEYTGYCDSEPSQCGIQKGGDYFFSIPNTQFNRLIKKRLESYNSQKITKSALQQLQYLTETSIVNSLVDKNKGNSKVFHFE